MNKITAFILGTIAGATIMHNCENYKPQKIPTAYWYDTQKTVRIYDDTTRQEKSADWTNYMIGTPKGKIMTTPENLYHTFDSYAGFRKSNQTYTQILEEDERARTGASMRIPLRAIKHNNTLFMIYSDSVYVGFDGIGGYEKIRK